MAIAPYLVALRFDLHGNMETEQGNRPSACLSASSHRAQAAAFSWMYDAKVWMIRASISVNFCLIHPAQVLLVDFTVGQSGYYL